MVNEEVQKEVEMTLLALGNIWQWNKVNKEQYLIEIKSIIQHHQEHHNLTRIGYQSAWEFLIKRFSKEKMLEDVIEKELHFVREARRELE
ncbi:uncharacterized protein MONOS_14068 [Monocercomonoides exilis]|uniref:uncharacterized protein n=1 Tax=Monocercomonoides exilis TaxID=2049356 RepID=UPI00355ABBF9|nr:hypothetical protein MONOS_14068 [Monocercomonoides exilis]|eukprot:MONOS_14068.1-p1 / transcript=MONOS_14068.1 / gene=MONOS_14068 / organism=Monocercomonoides_exilis_PA203 / gene_product=unspecified product / transcript_product=unspecified product / location=Mono_scaffold00931:7125-7468(+) / protein_length=90 / sequence_SO=supercontig / SO=protein_coding / is_pseudo=false